MSSDLDALKDIPGYKAILKSVLKSQVQLLLEQLSDQTGEESIILTASITDGTLSHLGSQTGRRFLEGRDEVKSQFLGYCLTSHHKRKTSASEDKHQHSSSHGSTPYKSSTSTQRQPRPVPYDRPPGGSSSGPGGTNYLNRPSKNSPLRPTSSISSQRTKEPEYSQARTDMTTSNPSQSNFASQDTAAMNTCTSNPSQSEFNTKDSEFDEDEAGVLKFENDSTSAGSGQGNEYKRVPSSGDELVVGIVDTDTTAGNDSFSLDSEGAGEHVESTPGGVKLEAFPEDETELEITGVEPGSLSQDSGAGAGPGLSYSQEQGELDGSATTTTPSASGQAQPVDSSRGFFCKFCGKFCGHSSWLARHERTHTKEKPHKCPVCLRGFALKHQLKTHLFTMHGAAELEQTAKALWGLQGDSS